MQTGINSNRNLSPNDKRVTFNPKTFAIMEREQNELLPRNTKHKIGKLRDVIYDFGFLHSAKMRHDFFLKNFFLLTLYFYSFFR